MELDETIAPETPAETPAPTPAEIIRALELIVATQPKKGWTDERRDLAIAYWQSGQSANRVASLIGGITRNAVIAKMHREGMAKRTPGYPIIRKKRKVVSYGKRLPLRPPTFVPKRLFPIDPFEPKEEVVVPLEARRVIATLEDHHCRWPIGDPQKPDFHFCGSQRVLGAAYCPHHFAIAYPTRPAPQPVIAKQMEPA